MWPRLFIALFALLLPPALHAHPVPKENHDRTVIVRLTPEAVLVDYRLEVDESRAVLDLPRSELVGVSSRKDIHTAFARYHARMLADLLAATLDGEELTFRCVERRHELLDHVRCDFRFRGDWKLKPGGKHRFTFRECAYEEENFNRLHVELDAGHLLTVADVVAPDDALLARPADRRRPGDGERLRRLSATVTNVPSSLPGVARPALPPELAAPKPPSRSRKRPAGLVKPAPPGVVALARTPPPAEVEPTRPGGGWAFKDLVESKLGLGVLLLLAAGFGAVHALTPGHGKTMVAAYLVGQRGTAWHALLLGLTTTLTHTGSVLAVALALWWFDVGNRAAAVVLHLVGGLLIAGIGAWLLMQRLTGRADHVHLDSYGGERPTWWTTVVLGVGGGIVPCWDAIPLLVLAVSLQKLGLGVLLLLAFSAGLAAVLVALGLVVVGASALARFAFAGGRRFERLVAALPIVSAVAIIVLGLLLAFGVDVSAP